MVALLHNSPDEISVGKSDISPELREKLQLFRDKVSTNRLVKFWNNATELPGLVALSLTKTIKMFPATGWVRTSAASSEELLGEVNELRKENTTLKAEVDNQQQPQAYSVDGLAGLDESFIVNGTYYHRDYGKREWASTLTWREIFTIISPYLSQNPNQDYVKTILKNAIIKRDSISDRTNSLDDQDFQTIAIQFKALGLITTKYAKTVKGNMAMFWYFTDEGEKLMVQLRAIPTKQ